MKKHTFMTTLLLVVAFGIALLLVLPVQAVSVKTAKGLVADCKKNIDVITADKAKKLFDAGDWLFLDVRTEKEYKKGNIPHSVHIQRGVLEFKIDKKVPDKSTKLILYCKSGSRATLSSCAMKKLGYQKVVMMDGGWKEWIKKGYPVN